MAIRATAVFLVLAMTSGAAMAQSDRPVPDFPNSKTPRSGGMFQGTPEEQAACKPDATRYCLDDMPDTFRVLACLQENRKKLRKACLKVLESNGQ